jgi:hypothetical protein
VSSTSNQKAVEGANANTVQAQQSSGESNVGAQGGFVTLPPTKPGIASEAPKEATPAPQKDENAYVGIPTAEHLASKETQI